MIPLPRTAAALGAAMILGAVAPLASLGEPAPPEREPMAEPAGVPRLAGADRHATAVVIAQATHGDRPADDRPTAAVLARADDFADALAGAPLAHHLDAPLLLTQPDTLPAATRDALGDLLAPGATVHVLGGPAAVGGEVATTLRDDGWHVARHHGPTRYGTAAAVADALPAGDLAYLASGVQPADALAAAPVAARRGAPVLLTDPEVLPEATATALSTRARVVLVGGTAAVSAGVARDLRADHQVSRVAGADRFATAIAVAQHAPGEPAAVSLASGRSWPDALTGAAHAAATDAVLLLADTTRLTWPTAEHVTRLQDLPVRLYGGEAAVAPTVERDVDLARDSDVGAPRPIGLQPGRQVPAGTNLRVQFTHELDTSDVQVSPSPASPAWQEGAELVIPLPAADGRDRAVTVEGRVTDAEGHVRRFREPVVVLAGHTTSPEGFRVAAGTGPVVGTDGPVVTWTAEVEPATGHALDAVRPVMAAALHEPHRGWTARGERRLQRIDDPSRADVRVVLATPDTVDAFCARIGADTAGIYSCWDGRRAMLNLMRWERGADDFDDLARYRTYQVNHEVGHGLGYGHVGCPTPGAPAPVMMQQTKTVGACRPNGWPYP